MKNQIAQSVRHYVNTCKSFRSSVQIKHNIFKCRKKRFANKVYRGYYTHRVVYNINKCRQRLIFGTLSLAVAIVEPTQEQKIAFIQRLKSTYNTCLINKRYKTDEFEKCKACRDHFKSYLKPLKEDIDEGCHLRDDIITYVANYCGIDEMTATDFLLTISQEDNIVSELCTFMSACALSNKTKAYPTNQQKKEFRHKSCMDCKKTFKRRLKSTAPKPFIINSNVKKETKTFTNIEENWLWGKENKKEYIERVCGIMGVCKD